MKPKVKPRRKGRGAGAKAPASAAVLSFISGFCQAQRELRVRLDWTNRYLCVIAHNTYLLAKANHPDGTRPVWTPRHPKGDAQIPLPLSQPPTTPTDFYENAAADGCEPDGIDSKEQICDVDSIDPALADHLFGENDEK